MSPLLQRNHLHFYHSHPSADVSIVHTLLFSPLSIHQKCCLHPHATDMVSIVPVPPRPLVQFHHNCIHHTTPFLFTLLTFHLHQCIFPFINADISIPMPPPWYPLYQFHFHHNHCFRTTDYVSITLWILCCIYHQCPPTYCCLHYNITIPVFIVSYLIPPFLDIKFCCIRFNTPLPHFCCY